MVRAGGPGPDHTPDHLEDDHMASPLAHTQLDLLDLIDQAAIETASQRQPLARSVTHWPDGAPVTWTAPWDCGIGPAGTTIPAVRCPCCGRVEPTLALLYIDHGITGGGPTSSHCWRQQALYHRAGGRLPAGPDEIEAWWTSTTSR